VEPYFQRHIQSPTLHALHTLKYVSIIDHILLCFEAVEPNVQRHTYTKIGFGFPYAPYLPYHFFLPLYHHFNFS